MSFEPFSLVDHMECHFGKIECGWKPKEWNDPAIQIVEFRDGKIPGATILSTLGMSGFALHSSVSKQEIHQELFLMVKDGQLSPKLVAALDQVARERVRSNAAVLRGELIRKQGSLVNTGDFVALYATLPIYYPDTFWRFHDPGVGDVVFGWLIPVTRNEQAYVGEKGWSAFEELLDKAQVDLFDLTRPSLV
jgi:hypothetical protein